jgi:hypothetical protein
MTGLAGITLAATPPALASNYQLAAQPTVTGTITPKPVTITGITAARPYNGTTASTPSEFSGGTVSGALAGETLAVNLTAASGTYASKDVHARLPLTNVSGITLAATSPALASNYRLAAQPAVPGTITPKYIIILGVTATKVYDGTNVATASQFSGGTIIGAVAGETVSLDLSGISGTYASSNVHTSLNMASLSSFEFAFTVAPPALASNYRFGTLAVVYGTITTRTVTITGITATKNYDGNDASTPSQFSGGTVSGAVVGETLAVDLSAASGTYASSNVHAALPMTGVSGITLAATPPALASNYLLAAQPAVSGSITAITVAITGITATKTYDGNSNSTPSQFSGGTVSGALAGETLAVDLSAASGSYASGNVHAALPMTGVSDIKLVVAPPALASNYRLATQPTVTGTITARPVTIAGVTATKVYDSSAASTSAEFSGGTVSGALAGETLAVDLTAASGTYASKDVHAGLPLTNVSGISLAATSPALASNYRITTLAAVTGTVTPKLVTITGITAARPYNGSTASTPSEFSGGTVSGVITGETLTVDLSAASGTYASSNVHAALPMTAVSNITLVATPPALTSNYQLAAQPSASGTVTALQVTITGITASKTYDGNAASAPSQFTGGTVSGAVTGETLTVDLSAVSGSYASKDVHAGQDMTGVTGITLVATPPALASNYQLAPQPTVSGTVEAKTATITGVTATKTYDGSTTSAPAQFSGGTVSGAISGETLTADFSAVSASYSSRNVHAGMNMTGVTGITLVATPPALASNYRLAAQPAVLGTVTARTASIQGVTVSNKAYDGSTTASLVLTVASVQGVLPGDTVTINSSSASASFDTKDAGDNKTVAFTGFSLTGSSAANYSLITQPAATTANITRANITIAGITATKPYDGGTASAATQFSGGTISGAVAGETLAVNLTQASGIYLSRYVHADLPMASVAGITFTATSPALASNYQLTGQPAVAGTVTAKNVTVTGITATKIYDGNDASDPSQFTGGTVSGAATGETLTVELGQTSGTYFSKDVHAGQPMTDLTDVVLVATLPALASNYQIAGPVQASGTITARPVTITDVTATKPYDGTTTSAPSQFSGGTVSGAATGEALGPDFSAASGSYASKDAQGGQPMTGVAGITLNATPPALASNYQLTGQLAAVGTIMPRALSFTGTLLAPTKPYDGATTAPAVSSITVVNPTSFSGLVGSEGFTLSTRDITSVDAYPSAEGGNYALSYRGAPTLTTPTGGALTSNYQLSVPTISASITFPIRLTVTTTAVNQILYLNKYFDNSYGVDWGDGSPPINKPAGTTSHTYAGLATYTVTLAPFVYSEYAQWTFSSTNVTALVPRTSTVSSVSVAYLPAMHFFMTGASTAPGYFFSHFNNYGAITSLPAGSFNTSAITTAPARFFYQFNRHGFLTSLPAGSFNTSAITAAGSDFFSYFNYYGTITSLPAGSFNTSHIATAGDRFFSNFNYYGAITSVPASFLWPSIPSPTSSSNFWYSFNSNVKFGGSTTAQSIINGCPTPSFKAYTFSPNQPGFTSLPANWQG